MQFSFRSNRREVEAAMKGAIRTALDTVGDLVVGWAQDLAPVDTGNLKSSLDHKAESNDVEIVGTSRAKAPYKDVEYAVYVELGTHRMNAQPFLRPAIEHNRSTIKEVIRDTLSE